jgi:hypothetical protein
VAATRSKSNDDEKEDVTVTIRRWTTVLVMQFAATNAYKEATLKHHQATQVADLVKDGYLPLLDFRAGDFLRLLIGQQLPVLVPWKGALKWIEIDRSSIGHSPRNVEVLGADLRTNVAALCILLSERPTKVAE